MVPESPLLVPCASQHSRALIFGGRVYNTALKCQKRPTKVSKMTHSKHSKALTFANVSKGGSVYNPTVGKLTGGGGGGGGGGAGKSVSFAGQGGEGGRFIQDPAPLHPPFPADSIDVHAGPMAKIRKSEVSLLHTLSFPLSLSLSLIHTYTHTHTLYRVTVY